MCVCVYAYVIVMDMRAMAETLVNNLSHRCAAVSAEDGIVRLWTAQIFVFCVFFLVFIIAFLSFFSSRACGESCGKRKGAVILNRFVCHDLLCRLR